MSPLSAFLGRFPLRTPRRARQASLTLLQRLLCVLIILIPPAFLAGQCFDAFIDQLDGVLQQSAPLASALLTETLGREVSIEHLSPGLDVRGILDLFQRRESLGTIPIVAEGVLVANGRSARTSGELASARRVTLYLSIPNLLSGDTMGGVPRLVVDSPRFLLIRRANGLFNVQEILPASKGPSKAPFRSRVEVVNGTLRFRDLAAHITGSTFQENTLSGIKGYAALETRTLQFEIAAAPCPVHPPLVASRGA